MPRLTDQLLHEFRDKIHEDKRFLKLYRNWNGKNKWNIICSATDWIQVTVGGIDTDCLIRENSDDASRRLISFIHYIDIMWEGISQLHRVLFDTKNIPFKDDHSVFAQVEDDNTYFKTIRAIFAAHPVNLYNFKPDPAYASWSGGYIGYGDFSVILYSSNPDTETKTFSIKFNKLFHFAKKRYMYLRTLSNEVDRQIEADNEKWRNHKIPDRSTDILAHIELLKKENEKRLENDHIKMRLEDIQRAFSAKISDTENEKVVEQFRNALLADLDYYQNCLQKMCLDDNHQDVEGECPSYLLYAMQQISDINHGLFWPAIKQITPYLSDIVDLSRTNNIQEIQVLIDAGMWLKECENHGGL